MTALKNLQLGFTRFKPEGFKNLKNLKNLKTLIISGGKYLDDSVLEQVGQLDQLTRLEIYDREPYVGTKITDAGVEKLAGLQGFMLSQ